MEQKPYNNNEIRYTKVSQTVDQFAADPHGGRVINFLEQAYGITNPVATLEAAGMGEYLHYKDEGRFIGLFASQILKPSFYNLTSAIVLGELAKQGLPAALMVFEYPQDVFNPRNVDKVKAFGSQTFLLGEESVKIKVEPVETKTINYLAGKKLSEIIIKVTEAIGPVNQPYFNKDQIFLWAALGIELTEIMSLTDFYRILWIESINRLRREGILPKESVLPMFFVDMVKLYTHLNETIGRRGMMKSGDYYPFQVAWPDLYLEDSGGSGANFEASVIAAQNLRRRFNLPEVQVKIPYREVPELDRYLLHPTGTIVDLRHIWTSRNAELQELGKARQKDRLAQVIAERDQAYFTALNNDGLNQYQQAFPVTFPSSATRVYQGIIQGGI